MRLVRFNDLSLDNKERLCNKGVKIDSWYGKTLYTIKNGYLLYKKFNIFELVFHRLFGYKSEFNREYLIEFLKQEIPALKRQQLITERIAVRALAQYIELKKQFFSGNLSEEHMIDLLKNKGLSVDATQDSRASGTTLAIACKRNMANLVKYLIDHGVNVNQHLSVGWQFSKLIKGEPRSALDWAIKNNNKKIIDLLLKKGAVAREFKLPEVSKISIL